MNTGKEKKEINIGNNNMDSYLRFNFITATHLTVCFHINITFWTNQMKILQVRNVEKHFIRHEIVFET